MPSWQHFEHRADIGIRGIGDTPAEAFEQAASAMTALICPLDKITPKQSVSLTLEEEDLELLLVDWLNALIYEMSVSKLIFNRFTVVIEGNCLTANAWGETISREHHRPAVEIKGATYTELQVIQQPDKQWLAQCVVDV